MGGKRIAGRVEGEGVVYARLWHFAFFKLSADRRYLAVDTKQAHATRFFIRKDKKRGEKERTGSGLAGGNATRQVHREAGLILSVHPRRLSFPPSFSRRFAMETAPTRLGYYSANSQQPVSTTRLAHRSGLSRRLDVG